MHEEDEYRVPVKLLTNRDPIIGEQLSIREMAQWLVVVGLVYLFFKLTPLPFQINLIVAGVALMAAVVFIHVPVNGLSGLEWIFINVRYRLEKKLHQATGVEIGLRSLVGLKPAFNVSLKMQNLKPQPGSLNPDEIESTNPKLPENGEI